MGRVRLVRGHGVKLVRWRPAEQGWVADVRRGRRLAEDADGWTVLIGGRTERFERTEWTEFIGELVPPGASTRTPLVEDEHGEHLAEEVHDVDGDSAAEVEGGSLYARSSTLIDIPSTRPILEPPSRSPDGDAPGRAPTT